MNLLCQQDIYLHERPPAHFRKHLLKHGMGENLIYHTYEK